MATPPQKAFGKTYTIWDSVKTFHIGLKIFGYASFSFDGDIANGKLQMNFFDILMFLFINSVTICLIYLNWAFNLSLITTTSRVINIGSRFVLLFEITNVLVSIISMYFRRQEVWGIFTRCYKFDEEMKVLKMALDHKKNLRNFTITALLMISIFISMTVISSYYLFLCIHPAISMFLIPSYSTINASMTISLMSIAFTLFAIYRRFQLVNDALKKFFVTEEEDEPKAQKSSTLLCKIIAKLADQHDSLVDIVNLFNKCFSFQLMNVIAGMFLTNIFRLV